MTCHETELKATKRLKIIKDGSQVVVIERLKNRRERGVLPLSYIPTVAQSYQCV
jgi:hypothetical protein